MAKKSSFEKFAAKSGNQMSGLVSGFVPESKGIQPDVSETAEPEKVEEPKEPVSITEVMPEPVAEEPIEVKQEVVRPAKAKKAPEPKEEEVPTNMVSRLTVYLTYEEMAAIDKLCFEKRMKKTHFFRTILDEGLNKMEKGILKDEEVLRRANAMRKEAWDVMPEDKRQAELRKAKRELGL